MCACIQPWTHEHTPTCTHMYTYVHTHVYIHAHTPNTYIPTQNGFNNKMKMKYNKIYELQRSVEFAQCEQYQEMDQENKNSTCGTIKEKKSIFPLVYHG